MRGNLRRVIECGHPKRNSILHSSLLALKICIWVWSNLNNRGMWSKVAVWHAGEGGGRGNYCRLFIEHSWYCCRKSSASGNVSFGSCCCEKYFYYSVSPFVNNVKVCSLVCLWFNHRAAAKRDLFFNSYLATLPKTSKRGKAVLSWVYSVLYSLNVKYLMSE